MPPKKKRSRAKGADTIDFKVPTLNFQELVTALHSAIGQLQVDDISPTTVKDGIQGLLAILKHFEATFVDPQVKHLAFSSMTGEHLKGMGYTEGRLNIDRAKVSTLVTAEDAIKPSKACLEYLHRMSFLTDALKPNASEASAVSIVGIILCDVAWQMSDRSTKMNGDTPQVFTVSELPLPLSSHMNTNGYIYTTKGVSDLTAFNRKQRKGVPLTGNIVLDPNEVNERNMTFILIEVKSEANFASLLHYRETVAQAANAAQTLLKGRLGAVRIIMADNHRWKFGIVDTKKKIYFPQGDHFAISFIDAHMSGCCQNKDDALPHDLEAGCMERVYKRLCQVMFMLQEWITHANDMDNERALFEKIEYPPTADDGSDDEADEAEVAHELDGTVEDEDVDLGLFFAMALTDSTTTLAPPTIPVASTSVSQPTASSTIPPPVSHAGPSTEPTTLAPPADVPSRRVTRSQTKPQSDAPQPAETKQPTKSRASSKSKSRK